MRSVNEVPAADWCATSALRSPNCLTRGALLPDRDACASGACSAEGGTNPFLSHGFMRALEDSGSVAPQRGWGVSHLVARDAAGALLGVAPLYVKSHSYGYAAHPSARRQQRRAAAHDVLPADAARSQRVRV